MSFDVLELVLQASLIVKLVLLVLVAFSGISWAIIASKWLELRRASDDDEAFLAVYHEASLACAFEAARLLDRSPLAAIFMMSCSDAAALAKRAGRSSASEPGREEIRVVQQHLAWGASASGSASSAG